MINQGDIIKVFGELLYVTAVNNQGTFKCKDKHGRLVWTSYIHKPVIVRRAKQ